MRKRDGQKRKWDFKMASSSSLSLGTEPNGRRGKEKMTDVLFIYNVKIFSFVSVPNFVLSFDLFFSRTRPSEMCSFLAVIAELMTIERQQGVVTFITGDTSNHPE